MERLRPIRTRLRLVVLSLTPLFRVFEGVLAAICLVGVALSVFAAIHMYAISSDLFGFFDWTYTRFTVGEWIAMFALGFVWFAAGAIRGGSTPTEGSERGRARQGGRA